MWQMWRLAISLVFWISCSKNNDFEKNKIINDDYHNKKYKVIRIIDGDTFEIENGERVRLIGIDTPEKWDSDKLNKDIIRTKKDIKTIKFLGYLSTMYSDSILYHKNVLLVKDSTNDNRDKYNRLLRYAYINDTILFNKQIIKDGYAHVYLKYPFILSEDFIMAEKLARNNHNGLWSNKDFKDLSK